MIIGIDNALSGGLCAISAHHGLIIAKAPMPTKIRTHAFKKLNRRVKNGIVTKKVDFAKDNEIDAAAVVAWIRSVTDSKPCKIAIEECPEHAQQKSIMRSMAISYGILLGAIGAALPEYQVVIVRSGNPSDSWQRTMLGQCAQGQTKSVAIEKAKSLWPDEEWRASPRCSTPHDGMIDAALIAEFARISGKS